ncbi:PadR family transcriptional regulator [Bacillus cihuensis]|uniref:PadR family transcriptional regulator n=1 Tax=Bacillus cihuensis TaxID=1208599 RepID=UPI00040ED9FE|nr:PadR family transcriptional regulator [Bacillus cihuensis]
MENRLRQLKKAMQTTVFYDVKFSEKHQNKIRQAIVNEGAGEEEVILTIFRMLKNEKSGFEIMAVLTSKGNAKFADNEGFLYALLHDLEQKDYIQSCWGTSEQKLYKLNDKGRKLLSKAETKKQSASFVFQAVMGG